MREKEKKVSSCKLSFDRKVRVRCLQGSFLHNEMCINIKNMQSFFIRLTCLHCKVQVWLGFFVVVNGI